jgi:hypothetical protein
VLNVYEIRTGLQERLLVLPQLRFYMSPQVFSVIDVGKIPETRVLSRCVGCSPVTVICKFQKIISKALLATSTQYVFTVIGYLCMPLSAKVSGQKIIEDTRRFSPVPIECRVFIVYRVETLQATE